MIPIPPNPFENPSYLPTNEEIDEEFDRCGEDIEEDMTVLEPGADETTIDLKKFKVVEYEGRRYRQKIKPIWDKMLGKLQGLPYLVPRPVFNYLMRKVPRTKETYREAVRARYQKDDIICIDLKYTENGVEKTINFHCDSRKLVKDFQANLERLLKPEKTFKKIFLLFGTTNFKLIKKPNTALRDLIKTNPPRFIIRIVFQPMTPEEVEEQKKKDMEERPPIIDITEECEAFEEENRREMRGIRQDTRKEQLAQRARRQQKLMARRAQRSPSIEWLDTPAGPAPPPPRRSSEQAVPRRRSPSVEEIQILDPVLPERASEARDPEPLDHVPARTGQASKSRAPEPEEVRIENPAPEQVPASLPKNAPESTASVLQRAAAILKVTAPETPEQEHQAPPRNDPTPEEPPVTPAAPRKATKPRASSKSRDSPAPEEEAPVQPRRALRRRNSAQEEPIPEQPSRNLRRRNSRDPTSEQPVSRRTRRASREQSHEEVATVQLRRNPRRRNSAQREPSSERVAPRRSSRLGSRAESRNSVRAESPEQDFSVRGRRGSTCRARGASEEPEASEAPQRERGRPRSRGSEESPADRKRLIPAPIRNVVRPTQEETGLLTPESYISSGSENEEEEEQMPALAMAIDDDLGAGNEEEPPRLENAENPEEETPQHPAQLTPPPPVVHQQAPPPKEQPAVPKNLPRPAQPTVTSQSNPIKRTVVVPNGSSQVTHHPLPENGVTGIEEIRRCQKDVIEAICIFFQFDFVLDVQDPKYDEILNRCLTQYQKTVQEQEQLKEQLNIYQDSLEDAQGVTAGEYNERAVEQLNQSLARCRMNLRESFEAGRHYCEVESNKAKYNIKQRHREEQKHRQMVEAAAIHGQMTPQGNHVLYGKISPNGQIIVPGQTPQQQRVLIPQGTQLVVQQPIIIPPQVLPKKRMSAPGPGQMAPNGGQVAPMVVPQQQQIIMTPHGPMLQPRRFVVKEPGQLAPSGQASSQMQINPQGKITVPDHSTPEGQQQKRVPHILQKPRGQPPVGLQYQGAFVPGLPQQNGQTPRFITSSTPLMDDEVLKRLVPVGKSPQNSGSPPQNASTSGISNGHSTPTLPTVAARTLAAQLTIRSTLGASAPPTQRRPAGPPPAHQTTEDRTPGAPTSRPASSRGPAPTPSPAHLPGTPDLVQNPAIQERYRTPIPPTHRQVAPTPLPAHQTIQAETGNRTERAPTQPADIDHLVQAGINNHARARMAKARTLQHNFPSDRVLQIHGSTGVQAVPSRGPPPNNLPGHQSMNLAQQAKMILASTPSAPPVFRRPSNGGLPPPAHQTIEDRTGIRTSRAPSLAAPNSAPGHQSIRTPTQQASVPSMYKKPQSSVPPPAHQTIEERTGIRTSRTPAPPVNLAAVPTNRSASTIPTASVNHQQLAQGRTSSQAPSDRRSTGLKQTPPGIHTWTPPVPEHNPPASRTPILTPPNQSMQNPIRIAPRPAVISPFVMQNGSEKFQFVTWRNPAFLNKAVKWTYDAFTKKSAGEFNRKATIGAVHEYRRAAELMGVEKHMFLDFYHRGDSTQIAKDTVVPVGMYTILMSRRLCDRSNVCIPQLPAANQAALYELDLRPEDPSYHKNLMFDRFMGWSEWPVPTMPMPPAPQLPVRVPQQGPPPPPPPMRPTPPTQEGPPPAKKRKAYKPSKCVEEPSEQPSTSDSSQINHSPTSSEASAEL